MNNHSKNQVKTTLEALTWKQVRKDVIRVNPELAKVIDKIDPSDKYTLFKVTYPYGAEILKKALLYLPDKEGKLISITDSVMDPKIREKLSYNLDSNPVTLVLKNSLELFLTMEDRTVPLYGIIPEGKIFGLSRIWNMPASHQPAFIWDMTAGARSIFMLPKIAETERHNKIKRAFQISAEVPRTLMEHWQIFRELAIHPQFPEAWDAEVLFFSKEWFEHINDDAWTLFNYFLMRTVWQASEFWRNQFLWDLMFSIIQKNKSLKPSPYIADTVKYLFAVGIGALPGFAPALNSANAPIKGLQEVYTDFYNLKNYHPIIMEPRNFLMYEKKTNPVYYSLQFPSAVDFGPKTRDRTSFITDLYEIKSLFNKYLNVLSEGQFKVEATPFHDLIKLVAFDYFHNNVEQYHDIRESKDIPLEDKSFLNGTDENLIFPATSTFLRGCIRISHKEL